MRSLGALLLVLNIGAAEVRGQEPRLPAPSATPSESEALILRARALVGCGKSPRKRSYVADDWRARARHRQPGCPRIDSRVDRCRRHRAGLERSHRARHRCAFRPPDSRRRCVPCRPCVRLRDVPVSPGTPDCGPVGRCRRGRHRPGAHARAGWSSCAKPSRRIVSFNSRFERLRRLMPPTAGPGVCPRSLHGAEPLTEAGFRLDRRSPRRCRGIPARRGHADGMAEELPGDDTPRRDRVGHGAASLLAARERRGATSGA